MLAKGVFPNCILRAVILTAALATAQNVHREIVGGDDDREPAPRFHAKSLDGEQFNNDSTKGKVVLFQFWTTWCPVCKSEEGLVNDLSTEFAGKGLIVIAVDVAESKKVVQQYLKDHPRKCHIVMTGDTNLAAMYAAKSYPIYVVVDREGKIVHTQRGAGGARSLRRMLSQAGLESKESD
jgi:cytochrome c biogenesis protein CcmG, thiol:disulfide interchange protein DsbE